jgi:hypothetical protein
MVWFFARANFVTAEKILIKSGQKWYKYGNPSIQ